MARWSNATLVALGGFDKNVIIDELLYGEDNYYDITFLNDTLRTVQAYNSQTLTVTIAGGDSSIFTAGDYVSFGDTSSLFEIASVSSTQITLSTGPQSITTGVAIQNPINLLNATFEFRMRQQTATISDDPGNRNGATITNISVYPGSEPLNLDSNVKTNIPSMDITKGQIRVLINGGDLKPAPADPEVAPALDTTTPNFFTGFISVTLPAPDNATPAQVKKQRICFVVRSDGTQLPQ